MTVKQLKSGDKGVLTRLLRTVEAEKKSVAPSAPDAVQRGLARSLASFDFLRSGSFWVFEKRFKSRASSGQVLVEFALLLPIYAILLLTLVWFSDFGAARFQAQEGARWAAWQKKGWRGEGPASHRMAAHESLRDAWLSCQAYRGKGGGLSKVKGVSGQIGGVFSSVLETREGRADLRFEPLPYPYPGRRDVVRTQAAFVVDPIVPATSWLSRAMKMFSMKNPPTPPQVQ